MEPRMIKTGSQYEAALAEVERLVSLDPKPGTPEADRLELLAHLVQTYEKEHFPIAFPDPIEAIRFRMEQQGLSQRDLVPYFGSRSKVSEVLSGRRPLTLTMIRSVHTGLGIHASVLLGKAGNSLPPDAGIQWDRFPLAEMAARGWIEASPDPQGSAEELIRAFFAPLEGAQSLRALYRRTMTERSTRRIDRYAVLAWTARVLMLAEAAQNIAPYDSSLVDKSFLREVAQLSWFDSGPILARELLAKRGICLIIEGRLRKTYIDGAAMLTTEGRPVIGLTLRHDRLDNFWFCLLHELVHISRHLESSDAFFVDDLEAPAADRMEREADQLAIDALIPQAEWRRSRALRQKTPDAIHEFADAIRVHPSVIAGHIRHQARNYRILSQMVAHRIRPLFEPSA